MTEAEYPSDAWEQLSGLLTPQRREKILNVIAKRTNYLRLVIQDIHNPHNVSACLRSAEAFGIQNVDIVTLKENFRPSSVARGVSHWLTLHKWDCVERCAHTLKADGYKIFGAVPKPTGQALTELPTNQRFAVVFGNEHDGIDDAWTPYLDDCFTIPMVGMVESLNISVAVAVCLHHMTSTNKAPPGLTHAERSATLNRWVCHSIRSWKSILERKS